MTKRLCFEPDLYGPCKYTETEYEFTYYAGFALSQKQKSIVSLHSEIKKRKPNIMLLEVSSKSSNPLGAKLSAFNMKIYSHIVEKNVPLENVFQSAKVFATGGPYTDLLNMSPREAKKDERLRTSGLLQHFDYEGEIWPLEPKSIFYDWIYIHALDKLNLEDEILKYNGFTDIEFNHSKSVNCQARSVALYNAMLQLKIKDKILSDKGAFLSLYGGGQLDVFNLI